MALTEPREQEPSKTDDGALYLTLKEQVIADIDALRDWRFRAKENFGFVPPWGQWDAKDRAFLEEQQRPVVAFDKTSKFVRAVCGIEVNNRAQTTYIPTEPNNAGEVKANELLTVGSDWMDETSDAPRHQSRAFRDLFICGVGSTESTVSYDDDPEGLYVETRINPLEIGWDKDARDQNVMDSKRRWRVRCMTVKEAQELLMSVTDEEIHTDDLDASWAAEVMTPKGGEVRTQQEKEKREETKVNDDPKRTVHIVQVQWREFEPYMWVPNPQANGPRYVAMSPEEYKALNTEWKAHPNSGGQNWPAAKLRRKVFKQAFLGDKVLWSGPAPRPDGFTINIMTGEPDDNEGTFYGMVDLLRDPQKWSNKLFSQLLHMVNSTAKGGILIESDAVEDVREFLANYPRADAVSVLKPGAIAKGKVMAKPGVAITAGVMALIQLAEQAFSEVTGMNLELMGLADREQAGVLEAQRKQAAMTILATLFDSLSLFRKEVGRTRLYFMQNFLVSDERWIMLDSKDGPMAKKLTRQDTAGKYNTRVADAPSAPNTKERAWASVQPVLPFFEDKMTPDLAGEIVEMIPGLPSKLVEAFKKALAEPNPQAEEQAALAKEGATAQIDKDKGAAASSRANAVLSLAKAAEAQAKADTERWQQIFARFGMANAQRQLPPPDADIIAPNANQPPQPRQLAPFGEAETTDQPMPTSPPPQTDLVLPGGLTNGGMQ